MTSVTSKLLTILTTGLQGPIIDSLAQGKPGEGDRRDAIRRSQTGENLSVGGRRYGRGPRSRKDLRSWWNDGPCLEGRGLEDSTWRDGRGDGPIRLWQNDAAQLPLGPRRVRQRRGLRRRRVHLRHVRQEANPFQGGADGLRIPDLQPHPSALGGRECGAAAPSCRSEVEGGARAGALRPADGRTRGPGEQKPERNERRPAAAGHGGSLSGQRTVHRVGR